MMLDLSGSKAISEMTDGNGGKSGNSMPYHCVEKLKEPLRKIVEEIHALDDAGDLTAYVDGGITIAKEALTILCKKESDCSNKNALRKARGLVERAFSLAVWAALPELHEAEFEADAATQTEFQIPELELEHSIRSIQTSDGHQSARVLKSQLTPLHSKRGTKPPLSPLKRLPSFNAQNFNRVDGSFYFGTNNKVKSTDIDSASASPQNGHVQSHASRAPPPRNFTLTALTYSKADPFCKDPPSPPNPFATDLHPFGETLFLDPLRDGLIRCPIDDVHKYIGIFIMRATGEVCLWNPKMEEMTGISEAEACGNHINAFLLSNAEHDEVELVMEQAREFKETQQIKLSLMCQDGANRCVVTVALVSSVYPEGEFQMAYCHERTPAESRIDCIQWTVASLKNLVEALPQSNETNKVREAAVRLERVCNRQTAKAWGSIVVSDLFGKLRTHYCDEAVQHNVELVIDTVHNTIPNSIETDVKNLPQIIGYLIHNAIRFNNNENARWVKLEAKQVQSDRDDETGGKVTFIVTDNGPGIATELIDMVRNKAASYDVEEHTEQTQKGFGLIMAHLIVAECGGELVFNTANDSNSDEASDVGSKVSIVLPLIISHDSADNMAATLVKDRGVNMTIKVLVVQSNAVIRSSLCHYMWLRKYAVSIAATADEVSDISNVNILILDLDESRESRLFGKLKTVPNLHIILTANDAGNRCDETEGSVQLLTLPLKPAVFTKILNSIEDTIQQASEQLDKIEMVRKAFRTEQDTCPWERKKKIGSGAFGEVFEAVNTITKGVMAVKVIRLHNTDENQALEVTNEVQMMFKLQHPNIIHYFHSQLQDEDGEQQLLIFMEYASGGSLASKVKGKPVPPEQASAYTTDVLQGLHFLHSHNIIHRDIKTANILITMSAAGVEVCKVTDFGTAKELNTRDSNGGNEADGLARSLKGTPNFMAPEVMNEEPYDSRADIWSVGCLVLELLTGKPPFSHISENPWNVIRYVCSLKPDDVIEYSTLAFVPHVNTFLAKSVVVTPSKRLSCEMLMELPFIVEMNQSLSNRNDLMKIYKKTSLAPRKATKVTFGLKWKDDLSDSGGNFSGWGGSNEEPDSPGSPGSPVAGTHRARARTITRQLAFKEQADKRRSISSQISSNSGWN